MSLSDPNPDNVNHLQDFGDLLDRLNISRENICIFGSSTMALFDIKNNPDIDFIALTDTREKLTEFAKNDADSRIVPGVRTELLGTFELLIEDRLTKPPYLFELSDAEVITNSRYHIELDGFKFLRPELLLSMKGAKRRGKDKQHIKLIEESGLIETYDWDWNLVYVVPPWQREWTTERNGLAYRFVRYLKKEGFLSTLSRSSGFLAMKCAAAATDAGFEPGRIREAYRRLNLSSTLINDTQRYYPLPNLIARQYDEHENFDAINLLESLLALEEGDLPKTPKTETRSEVVVSSTGKIQGGVDRIAQEIHRWGDDLPELAPDRGFPVRVDSARTETDENATLTRFTREQILDRKETLLKQSGAAFHTILWPPLAEQFDVAEQIIGTEVSIIESRDYYLGDNLREFALDAYAVDTRGEQWFRDNKINELVKYDPTIRVVTFEYPNPQLEPKDGYLMASEIYDLKMELRQQFQELVDEYIYSTCIHMTDNFEHNAHIRSLLNSLENQQH